MVFSGFTLIIALLSAWGFYRLLNLALRHPEYASRIRPDFLTGVVLAVFIRLALPCSFALSIRFPLAQPLIELDQFLSTALFFGVTGYGWISYIHLAGMGVALCRYHLQQRHMHELYQLISKDARRKKVSDFLPGYLGPDYPVLISPLVHSPFSLGRSYEIVIGDEPYAPEQMEMILMHELQHLANEDATYIRLCRYLQIFYWFLPFLYSFMDSLDDFFEIRVDAMVIRNFSDEKKLNYCQCLIDVCKQAIYPFRRNPIPATTSFVQQDEQPVSRRIRYIITCLHPKPTPRFYFACLIGSVLATCAFFAAPY